jgi:hypothetical protein
MKRCARLAGCSLACLFLISSLLICTLTAQESDVRGPDRGTDTRVHGIQVLPATDRPFTARDHITWTHTLEDGTVVKTHLLAFVARDSQGHIYRERRHFVQLTAQQRPAFEFTLFDPVQHTRTTCEPSTRVCTITDYRASTRFVLPPVGPQDNGTRNLARESLGTNTIDGLDVIGSLETLTISPGAMGNSQPLVTTKEFWFSPDLQVNLSVTRKDPRLGVQELQLVELSRTEPDPSVFAIPNGFVVRDARRGADNQVH